MSILKVTMKTVLIWTCRTVWCVVTPCGYNSTLENGQTQHCFHTWPAPPCFHTWPTLPWNTLRDTTSILTCDLFYPHWPALCFIIFHSTALCQIQIYVYSAELHCTVLWDITCTQWYNALDGTSMLVLHCVDCRRQPKAVITHTRVSVTQLLIRMNMNYELWTMSMNYGLWSWVLSMSMSFER